jgi:hypothetical protein
LPTQFPYPLCIGGSACPSTTAAYHRYSSLETDHRGFANPYGDQAITIPQGTFDVNQYRSTLKILQGTSWINMYSKVGDNLSNIGTQNIIWPYSTPYYNYYNYEWMYDFSSLLRENIDGSYPIFPLIAMISNPVNHIMGELQGCYAVPGYGGISAEDTFDISGDTYIAFPIKPNATAADFMCIKKE